MSRFDMSDLESGTRIGIECTTYSPDELSVQCTFTRFARLDKLTVDDRGLCVQVTYQDGEIETAHMSRITYVDGKYVP